ncbi:S41 family peptidase [Roseateles sp.]|uniref:S41 family peptidase n=1 Tax=Roseateles sp. TaxID=1971397 RepID=UPI00286BEE46|nr:S41 family peptidase [Roseateles sp.]
MSQRREVLKSLAAAPLLGLAARAQCAQGATPVKPELSAEDAKRDLRILQRAFADLHPGLHRYASSTQLDAAFAFANGAVAACSNRAQMVMLASQLAASVHCGHTWVNPYNQRQDVVDAVFQRADKLPLTLRWIEGRALVTGSAAPGLSAGSEILAIDGRPVTAIRDELLPLLRADGLHPGARLKRLSQLDSGPNGGAMDRLFPLRSPPSNGQYTLTLRERAGGNPRDIDVRAMTTAMREQVLPPPSTAWSFRIDGGIGVLTLPTFAFWRSDFKPKAFLQQTFEALRGVPYLIIDQRHNEGGDDAIGRTLLSHLLRKPLQLPGYQVESAYERVPYELARYLDTWDFGFFDRTGQVRKGAGRNWLLPDQPGYRIEPVATPYAGRTLVMIGPQNSSAGFLLARDIQRSGVARLLGQPTGGNLRGLNGGQLAWINLPASGVGVDIPLIASFAMGDPPDAGVIPDMAVAPRWSDALAGIDTEIVAARAQVKA